MPPPKPAKIAGSLGIGVSGAVSREHSGFNRTRGSPERVMTGYLEDARRGAYRVVGWQFLAALLAGAVGLLAGGLGVGEAALLGGLIAAAASLVMALRVFGGGLERDPRRFLGRMVFGEAFKFAATVLLFAVALVIMKAAFLPLILGYMAGFAAYWVGYMMESFRRAQ